MSNKTITLRSFKIANSQLKSATSNIMEVLGEKLKGSVANDRRLPLRSEPLPPEDLLSDYAVTERYIYGVMSRLVPTKEIKNIPDDFFNHSTIPLNEIKNDKAKTGLSVKEHYYFALNNTHLVTNLPANTTITRLQTYLNWITEALRGDIFYELSPQIGKFNVRMSSVKRITVSDPNTQRKKKMLEKGINSMKVVTLAKETILSFFGTVPNIDEIIDRNLLSAKLVVSFSKPKKMTEEEYEKELSAYMKPISDTENVVFNTKNGGRILGNELLHTKSCEIDLLEDGTPNEQTIRNEMTKYLIELKNL